MTGGAVAGGFAWARAAPALTALEAVRDARRVVEDTAVQAVAEARVLGAPWSAIGEALGVTRQAAQMRYGS